jgi:metal-responsive CopG/Arc/MetJ family transcriptional regulator
MPKLKVAVTIDASVLEELDEMIARSRFPNRSQAFETALVEKLDRLKGTRLARECAKLDASEEKAMAEEGLRSDATEWPDY